MVLKKGAADATSGMTVEGRPIDELRLRPPLVSVVVINLNYARFVGAALKSIRQQDYPHFECLVIDNGSTDDSLAVISQHIARDPRFGVLPLHSNHGIMGAFQIALDRAKGEFVAVLDADDIWFSNFLSSHVQVHLALRLGIAFTSSGVVEIDANSQIITGSNLGFAFNPIQNMLPGMRCAAKVPRLSTISNEDFELLNIQVTRIDPEHAGWFWSPGSANVYRRNILTIARPERCDRANFIAVDVHFNQFCHLLAGSAVIDRTLSGYRMHDKNASSTLPSMSHLRTSKKHYAQMHDLQLQEILRVLLARAEGLSWLIKDRYWRALDQQSGQSGDALREYYADPMIQQIIAEYLPHLIAIFGRSEVTKELSQRLADSALLSVPEFSISRAPVVRSPEAVKKLPASPRQEIGLIQLSSLCKLITPPVNNTFLQRVLFRLEQNFIGQPINKKIHFVVHTAKFNVQRLCLRIFPLTTRTFFSRVRFRLEQHFVGKPIRKKAQFVIHTTKFYLKRLRKKELQPGPAQSSQPLLRVAVHGTGSLGDFLSHMMFIQEFERQFGPMEIDFYAHPKKIDDARFVFTRFKFIRYVLNAEFLEVHRKNYDLIIQIRYIVKYSIEDHNRIVQHDPDLLSAITIADARLAPFQLFFDKHPFLDGLFARSFSSRAMNLADMVGYVGNVLVDRKTFPALILEPTACTILERYGLTQGQYITVHDGFDLSYVPFVSLGGTVTKCWPKHHWKRFVSLIKARLPDVLIVQVGASNAQAIDGVDCNLCNKTTLDEVAWVIKQSMLHIDGESGLVRLGHALHTKSAVIFGPTSLDFFRFDRNINLRSDTCNDCWWANKDWLRCCPRGLTSPECMESITPEMLVEKVAAYLESQRPDRFETSPISLYGDGVTERLGIVFADLLKRLNLAPVPASEHSSIHSTNYDNGIYVLGSKHWEYLKAWEIVERLSVELDRPLKVADVGGGRGALSAYLATKGHDVEVFDIDYSWDSGGDPSVHHRFRKWAAKNGLKVSYGSLFNVPAETGAYDLVLSISVLEHVPHKPHAIKEALRLLKPGGKLFLSFDFSTDGNVQKLEDSLRVEIFTPDRLKTVLASIGNPSV